MLAQMDKPEVKDEKPEVEKTEPDRDLIGQIPEISLTNQESRIEEVEIVS